MSQAAILAEVALEQPLECLAVAGLVARHFVHGVVDGVEIVLLRELGELKLAGGRAVLGVNAHFEILLRGSGHDLAEELGDLLFVLISLANREGVDLEAAFRRVMAKYRARDRSRWTPKDGG